MSKSKTVISQYRLGSKEQYEGLIKNHKESVVAGDAEQDKPLTNENIQVLLEQYNAAIQSISEKELKPVAKTSIDWDLVLMIPHLANQHFYAYLELIGLPFKFDRADWTRKKPKDPNRSKPSFSAFERFRRYVTSKSKFLNLKPNESVGVRMSLNGLE